MTSSLVGSEMCIRDSQNNLFNLGPFAMEGDEKLARTLQEAVNDEVLRETCLLYTSDAADDM
eukprot:697267-Prorocentrum_lima.AAC.1